VGALREGETVIIRFIKAGIGLVIGALIALIAILFVLFVAEVIGNVHG